MVASETSALTPTGPSIQLLLIGRNLLRAVEIGLGEYLLTFFWWHYYTAIISQTVLFLSTFRTTAYDLS